MQKKTQIPFYDPIFDNFYSNLMIEYATIYHDPQILTAHFEHIVKDINRMMPKFVSIQNQEKNVRLSMYLIMTSIMVKKPLEKIINIYEKNIIPELENQLKLHPNQTLLDAIKNISQKYNFHAKPDFIRFVRIFGGKFSKVFDGVRTQPAQKTPKKNPKKTQKKMHAQPSEDESAQVFNKIFQYIDEDETEEDESLFVKETPKRMEYSFGENPNSQHGGFLNLLLMFGRLNISSMLICMLFTAFGGLMLRPLKYVIKNLVFDKVIVGMYGQFMDWIPAKFGVSKKLISGIITFSVTTIILVLLGYLIFNEGIIGATMNVINHQLAPNMAGVIYATSSKLGLGSGREIKMLDEFIDTVVKHKYTHGNLTKFIIKPEYFEALMIDTREIISQNVLKPMIETGNFDLSILSVPQWKIFKTDMGSVPIKKFVSRYNYVKNYKSVAPQLIKYLDSIIPGNITFDEYISSKHISEGIKRALDIRMKYPAWAFCSLGIFITLLPIILWNYKAIGGWLMVVIEYISQTFAKWWNKIRNNTQKVEEQDLTSLQNQTRQLVEENVNNEANIKGIVAQTIEAINENDSNGLFDAANDEYIKVFETDILKYVGELSEFNKSLTKLLTDENLTNQMVNEMKNLKQPELENQIHAVNFFKELVGKIQKSIDPEDIKLDVGPKPVSRKEPKDIKISSNPKRVLKTSYNIQEKEYPIKIIQKAEDISQKEESSKRKAEDIDGKKEESVLEESGTKKLKEDDTKIKAGNVIGGSRSYNITSELNKASVKFKSDLKSVIKGKQSSRKSKTQESLKILKEDGLPPTTKKEYIKQYNKFVNDLDSHMLTLSRKPVNKKVKKSRSLLIKEIKKHKKSYIPRIN